ncbi:toll-like receptor 4 [Amphiura filiformis]|uniref:toll-like receptor 4 n=1 Tax=Amphiura filiformis TaxID=82378 RepID=UPI003B217052
MWLISAWLVLSSVCLHIATADNENCFNGLKELQVLSLRNAFQDSRHIISNLTKAFTHSSFESLQELRLDDNDFGVIGRDLFLFDGGKRSVVERISLRNCSLTYIQKGTFKTELMPELNYIDLSMNRIEEITDEQGFLSALDSFGNQLSINLTGNPFNCNCDLELFRTWLNDTKVHIVDKHSIDMSQG